MSNEEARLAAALLGQERSEKYRTSRTGKYFKHRHEDCSRGGKTASKSLVEWQKNNASLFLEQCKINGKQNSKKLRIPHMYLGIEYESKKSLQENTGMCNITFYKKLQSGDIQREIQKRETK